MSVQSKSQDGSGSRQRRGPRLRSDRTGPVLLLGAGTGEATCGILYLASHLRRAGLEAFVRLTDDDVTEDEIERSLRGLLSHVKPKLIGISLKWFHHVARAKLLAETIRRLDDSVEIVLGGNSATQWCDELLAWDCVDHVILGDGEAPLLALCRGDVDPPNVATRGKPKPALGYIQGTRTDDVQYSHFDDLFLSQLDRHSYSGWIAPGKGCGENCLYCSGTRGLQKATFGRARPFLRPLECVQADHREVVPRTWQLRYDFAGSTAEFLEQAWDGLDLSKHSATYFLWGVPPPELAQTLSRHLGRVYMVLDIGCFSEAQRLDTRKRGLLKPCPTDRELFEVIERCKAFPNLELEVSGIAGLPFSNHLALSQEKKLVQQVLKLGCAIGYQRLESQPGALVTEHPERFGMTSEATTFEQFLEFFETREPGDRSVPMVRYADAKLEAAVQRTSDEVDALAWAAAEKKAHVDVTPRSRLVNASVAKETFSLGHWLGSWRVPTKVADAKVTVLRSQDGAGLSCVPEVSAKKFSDPLLQQGDEAKLLLSVLKAFEKPTPVQAALKQVPVEPGLAFEVIEHLAAGKFLKPA